MSTLFNIEKKIKKMDILKICVYLKEYSFRLSKDMFFLYDHPPNKIPS